MADANNVDLTQFEHWYTQAGTPTVSCVVQDPLQIHLDNHLSLHKLLSCAFFSSVSCTDFCYLFWALDLNFANNVPGAYGAVLAPSALCVDELACIMLCVLTAMIDAVSLSFG